MNAQNIRMQHSVSDEVLGRGQGRSRVVAHAGLWAARFMETPCK